MANIKRKQTITKQPHQSENIFNSEPDAVNIPTKDASVIFEEVRQLRERQKTMEMKMNELIKLVFLYLLFNQFMFERSLFLDRKFVLYFFRF